MNAFGSSLWENFNMLAITKPLSFNPNVKVYNIVNLIQLFTAQYGRILGYIKHIFLLSVFYLFYYILLLDFSILDFLDVILCMYLYVSTILNVNIYFSMYFCS